MTTLDVPPPCSRMVGCMTCPAGVMASWTFTPLKWRRYCEPFSTPSELFASDTLCYERFGPVHSRSKGPSAASGWSSKLYIKTFRR